jgi:hypothetical protein
VQELAPKVDLDATVHELVDVGNKVSCNIDGNVNFSIVVPCL